MNERKEEEILDNWQFLQDLAQEEKNMELQVTAYLNWLMASYGYETALGG